MSAVSSDHPTFPDHTARPRTPGTDSNTVGNRLGGSGTRPLTDQLEHVIETWATSQYELVTLAAKFADSPEWILTGSPTAAHWLAIIADVEPCAAREWVRIGRCLKQLPATSEALRTRQISYSKARALTRLATADNETELLDIATSTTAAELTRALAAWLHRNSEPEDLAAHHHRQRSVKWRTEPDGMTVFTLRLPPLLAGMLISFLTTWVMTTRPQATRTSEGKTEWPSVAQQHADAMESLLTEGSGNVETEVIIHVTGNGNTLDDGTPIPDSIVADLIPQSFISALIHDVDGTPIDATNRRRHPTRRQKRVVKARDKVCTDCGTNQLLEYDHVPAYEQTRHTITTELKLRCAPCHHRQHATSAAGTRPPASAS